MNRKIADLINWYTALNNPLKYLPKGYDREDGIEILESLLKHIEELEIRPLTDLKMLFALSCILEEDVTDPNREMSVRFSDKDRSILIKSLPEDVIEYYESYDNYRELLISDTSYLNLTSW